MNDESRGNGRSDAREPGARSPASLAHVPRMWRGRVPRHFAEPARFAARAETCHPIVRALAPGEQWSYCYVDDVSMMIPAVKGASRIPPPPVQARGG
jgi:hypothetical protein